MRIIQSIVAVLLGLVITAGAQPTNQTSRVMSVQDCILLALQPNLDVQIERYSPIIGQFNLNGAYGAYDPTFSMSAKENYRASGGGFNSTAGFFVPANQNYDETYSSGLSGLLPSGLTYNLSGNMDRNSGSSFVGSNVVNRGFLYQPFAGITLDQPLLKNFWIDASRQQIWVNKKTLKIDELALRQQILTTVTLVEQAYYDLIFARENVKVQEKALELAERLLSENKKRVEVGALAPLDEKQSASQAAASRADLLSAQNSLSMQQNVLKNLIADEYTVWHDVLIEPSQKLVPVPQQYNLQESWRKGLTMRPDLQQLRVDLERRDIILRYQRNQLFPQLDLVGSYGRSGLATTLDPSLNDIRDERLPAYSYGAVLSFPLGNRTARNNARATKAAKEQALLQYKKLEQNILVQIDDSVKLAQTDFERVGATREARIYAEAALDAEQKKLENGKSTSYLVLLAQRDLTTRSSDEIRALADYNKALAQLALNEGTTLERNN